MGFSIAFVLLIKEEKQLGSKHDFPGKQGGCLDVQQSSGCREATA